MPRPSRMGAPGALHHVICRGIERRSILKDDEDRVNFFKRLGGIFSETKTSIRSIVFVTLEQLTCSTADIPSRILNHLGHDSIQSTEIYLHLDLNRRRHIQNRFIRHMQSVLTDDSKIEELLKWENEGNLMVWLDSLWRGRHTIPLYGEVRIG
jgi:hypothetical protein